MTKNQETRLRAVVERLEALITPTDDRCGTDASAREAVAPYIDSWVLPHLRVVLGDVRENGCHDLGLADAREVVARGRRKERAS